MNLILVKYFYELEYEFCKTKPNADDSSNNTIEIDVTQNNKKRFF